MYIQRSMAYNTQERAIDNVNYTAMGQKPQFFPVGIKLLKSSAGKRRTQVFHTDVLIYCLFLLLTLITIIVFLWTVQQTETTATEQTKKQTTKTI